MYARAAERWLCALAFGGMDVHPLFYELIIYVFLHIFELNLPTTGHFY